MVGHFHRHQLVALEKLEGHVVTQHAHRPVHDAVQQRIPFKAEAVKPHGPPVGILTHPDGADVAHGLALDMGNQFLERAVILVLPAPVTAEIGLRFFNGNKDRGVRGVQPGVNGINPRRNLCGCGRKRERSVTTDTCTSSSWCAWSCSSRSPKASPKRPGRSRDIPSAAATGSKVMVSPRISSWRTGEDWKYTGSRLLPEGRVARSGRCRSQCRVAGLAGMPCSAGFPSGTRWRRASRCHRHPGNAAAVTGTRRPGDSYRGKAADQARMPVQETGDGP